jgi:hypothetical protein
MTELKRLKASEQILIVAILIAAAGAVQARPENNKEPAQGDTIVVISPKLGDEVSAPFGFKVRIKNPSPKEHFRVDCGLRNEDGSTIDYVVDGGNAPDEWGVSRFSTDQGGMMYFCPKSDKGIFEVWGDFGKISVPVSFKKQSKAPKIYFYNDQMAGAINGTCSVVAFPVERPGLGTKMTPRAALEELLKGPTRQEVEQGYGSPIAGHRLLHFTIKNGTATVDMDKSFENIFDKAGSCQVGATLAPIEATLKQFCNIKSVSVTVGGHEIGF